MAIPLVEGQTAEHVLADKGYDSDEIVAAIEAMKPTRLFLLALTERQSEHMTSVSTKNEVL